MTIDNGAFDLLADYDRWKAEQAKKDPDVSPQGYLLSIHAEKALRAIGATGDLAPAAIKQLNKVLATLPAAEFDADEAEALKGALEICSAVQGAY